MARAKDWAITNCPMCGIHWDEHKKPPEYPQYICGKDEMYQYLGDVEEHEHEWGPMELSRFGGEPHKKCQVAFCNFISLDFDDMEDDDEQ